MFLVSHLGAGIFGAALAVLAVALTAYLVKGAPPAPPPPGWRRPLWRTSSRTAITNHVNYSPCLSSTGDRPPFVPTWE
jgi:hypothetical protein